MANISDVVDRLLALLVLLLLLLLLLPVRWTCILRIHRAQMG